ncbi:MAG: hypothetical protein EOM52_02485, partial [Clostridia bacterium]|nr:hypothetical protein [Clostridia bacterium]
MGSKKGIIAICLSVALVLCGLLGYSWQHRNATASAFAYSGYILTAEPGQQGKQVLFAADTIWREDLSDSVVFEDVQGSETRVGAESFAHYDNQSLSAMTRGVVVDLDDVHNAQVTNHYPVAPAVLLTS